MTFWPSPNKLGLAEACPHPWSVHRPSWPKRKAARSDAAVFGEAFALVAECATAWGDAPIDDIASFVDLKDSKWDELRMVGRHVIEHLAGERESFVWMWAEAVVAYNVAESTARLQHKAHGRDWSDQRDGELSCTPDLVGLRRDGKLVVRDYKTGYRQLQHPSLKNHRQLEAYAVAVARYFKHRGPVVLELALVDDSGVRIIEREIDLFELSSLSGWLRTFLGGIGAHAVPQPGPHCRDGYCPVISTCPATLRAMRDIERAADVEWPIEGPIDSPAQAKERHRRLKLVREGFRQRLDIAQTELEEYIRANGPVELEPGYVLSVIERSGKESVDLGVAGAWSAVQHHLGEHAESACVLSTTKGALEAACRKVTHGEGKGSIKGRREALYDDLRRIGGLRQGPPSSYVEEVKQAEAAE